jgi:hypothetical protein
MSSAALVLSWLVLCHLLADFVLQTESVATDKFGRGRQAWRALFIHVGVVSILAAPIILVYGVPGVAYVVVTGVTHLVIDRSKIELTLRSSPPSPPSPPSPSSPPEPSGGLPSPAGSDAGMVAGWSPMPGAWFLIDQLAHLAVLLVAWALLLANAQPLDWWQDLVARIAQQPDGEQVGRAVLVGIVLTALVIANVRAGSLFVSTLVRAPRPPLLSDVRGAGGPSEVSIGATIGIIERLLISALVLAGGLLAIGLVVAAKTLARFKQLDDRDFAEYYLLGTLASVTFAVVTSMVAQQALA